MTRARRIVLVSFVLGVLAAGVLGLLSSGRRDEQVAAARTQSESASLPSPPTDIVEHSDVASEGADRLDDSTPARSRGDEVERPVASAAVDPPPMLVVYGRVQDPAGALDPQWKPWVYLTDSSGVWRNAELDAKGRYSLAGLAPGSWTLGWGGTQFRSMSQMLELGFEQPFARRDLTLERVAVLKVRVTTPSGEPVHDALRARQEANLPVPDAPFPVATLEPPSATIEEAAVGGQNKIGAGSFWPYGPLYEQLGPGYLGVLVLSADPPVYVSLVIGVRVIATQRVELGTEEVAFVVDLDALVARQAHARAQFVAADTGEPLNGEVQSEDLDLMDDVDDGVWSRALSPGPYHLQFSSPGRATVPLVFALEAGQELDLGEVAVPAERTVAGRILDGEGKPVCCELAVARRDARGRMRFDYQRSFTSQSDGRYELSGLDADQYLVRTVGTDEVTYPGRKNTPTVWVSGNVPVSTLGGSVTGFDLHLVKAATLVLKGAETLPPRSGFLVYDEHGDVLRSSGSYPGFMPRFLIPPGAYTVVVTSEGKELARRAIELSEGMLELDLAH